jgi:hypothetical protein
VNFFLEHPVLFEVIIAVLLLGYVVHMMYASGHWHHPILQAASSVPGSSKASNLNYVYFLNVCSVEEYSGSMVQLLATNIG